MAEAKKPAANRTIIDVSHPGKTPPSDTSKPVIVTNRPVLKDPMVVGEDAVTVAENNTEVTPSGKATVAVKLRPLAEKTIEPTASEKTDEPATDTAKPEPKRAPAADDQEKLANAATDDKPDDTDSTTPETADGDISGDKKADPADADLEAEAAKQAEHDAAIQKLADSKQYFLPINSIEKRKTKRFVALGILLSLILAIAWLDVALDSGLVSLSANLPHTHFFDSSAPATAAPAAAKKTAPAAVGATKTNCGTITITSEAASTSAFKGCFDQHFQTCTPIQTTLNDQTSTDRGSVTQFQVISKQGSSCLVQWQYVTFPENPDWAGKTITCPYDNSKEFYQAFSAKTGNDDYTGCSGPLIQLLSQ